MLWAEHGTNVQQACLVDSPSHIRRGSFPHPAFPQTAAHPAVSPHILPLSLPPSLSLSLPPHPLSLSLSFPLCLRRHRAGDVLLLEHVSVMTNAIVRGDVVVSKSPTNPRHLVCKRVGASSIYIFNTPASPPSPHMIAPTPDALKCVLTVACDSMGGCWAKGAT